MSTERASLRTDYPAEPGFRRAGTSQEAAAAIAPIAKSIRAKVLAIIAGAPHGLTTDEAAEIMGKEPWQLRPRVSELLAANELVETPDRRPGKSGLWVSVWRVATPAERAASKEGGAA